MKRPALLHIVAALLSVALLAPESASACAACFGQSDSQLAVGLNWGISSLLAVVVFVLGGFAAFFIYLAKRAAAMAETPLPATNDLTTQQ